MRKTTSWAYCTKIENDFGYSFVDTLIRKKKKKIFLSIPHNCLIITIICINYNLIWSADKNNFARSGICLSEVSDVNEADCIVLVMLMNGFIFSDVDKYCTFDLNLQPPNWGQMFDQLPMVPRLFLW